MSHSQEPLVARTPEKLRRAASFVAYEMSMFDYAASEYLHRKTEALRNGREWRAGTASPDSGTRALVEVALLHARALREFLQNKPTETGWRKNDITAPEFLSSCADWSAPLLASLSGPNKDSIDRRLAHLSFQRLHTTRQTAEWEFERIKDELEHAYDAFLSALPAERRTWFVEAYFDDVE